VTSGRLMMILRSIARTEGVSGLYKGLSPSLLKAALSSGLAFLFYDLYASGLGGLG
jgi:hypothetical protein